MEATVQTDTAIAGDVVNFSMWFSLSRGLEIVGILIPVAFLALAWNEFLTPTPITPRWASALSMIGSMLVIIAIIGASLLRIVVFGSILCCCPTHSVGHLAWYQPIVTSLRL